MKSKNDNSSKYDQNYYDALDADLEEGKNNKYHFQYSKKCVYCGKTREIFEVFNKYGFCDDCNNQTHEFVSSKMNKIDTFIKEYQPENKMALQNEIVVLIDLINQLEALRPNLPFFKSSTSSQMKFLKNLLVADVGSNVTEEKPLNHNENIKVAECMPTSSNESNTVIIKNKVKWYNKEWLLWVLLIFVPLIGVPFMWIMKKNFKKRKKIVLSIVFAFWFFFLNGFINSIKEYETLNADAGVNSSISSSKEDIPNIELANDFEKAVWEIVKNHKGTLNSINSNTMMEENTVLIDFSCENTEAIVSPILKSIAKAGADNGIDKLITISIQDASNDSNSNIIIADIQVDGTIDMVYESPLYNSYRNVWIENQFSDWDGANVVLENLIISTLNDESSYKHIETTYLDINSEERMQKINKILSDYGTYHRVSIDDLFITTQFSAKNGFGGTIKCTAYGIASYSAQKTTLIEYE